MTYYTENGDGNIDLRIKDIARDMRLFIAMPIYDRVEACTSACLSRQINFLGFRGIRSQLHQHTQDSVPDLARCMCVAQFMASDATHLWFIDADVHWMWTASDGSVHGQDDIIRMMAMNLPVIGGTYPKKYLYWDQVKEAAKRGEFDTLETAGITWPHRIKPGGKQFCGVKEADRLPGGFMLIQRNVFETIRAKRPDLKFSTGDPNLSRIEPHLYAYFQHTLDLGKQLWCGEDYYFSDLCRACGIEVYVDTLCQIAHMGKYLYTGNSKEIGLEPIAA